MPKKFYITTSIPYTNAPPHIGHVLEFVQADVMARYHRSLKEDVFFLTGTDEHGLKTLRAAQAVKKEIMEFADEMSGKFRELSKVLNVSNNDFIRTTDKKRHLPAVYALWEKFKESGDIYKKKYKGFYCPGCEAFKTEKELKDSLCTIHQKPVEEIEEENYFFKLSKYLPEIKKIVKEDKIKIIPHSKKNEILAMIESGIEDVSFSRAKEKYSGISVPGDSNQIIYVWADALPNYISAIGYGTDEKQFKKFWPADVHCIGKDIVKFHAIYWPAMLLSVGLELPKSIFVHGFVTSGGQKMSKSLGNVIDPFELVKKYGTDAVRYYLLSEITPTEDGDFTYEKFEKRYNAYLAGGIGNLLARVLTLAVKPDFKEKKPESFIKNEVEVTRKKYTEYLENYKFNESLGIIWLLIGLLDAYINNKKPWEENKESSQTVSNVLFALEKMSDLLLPFLPETAEKIKDALKSKKSVILFPRIK